MLRTSYFGSLLALAAAMATSLLLFLGTILPAKAQSTITVNTTTDESAPPTDNKCSLREAITNANDNAQTFPDCPAGSSTGEDTITFALAPSSTIWLNSTLPTIEDGAGLVIDGGQSSITASGGNEVRVLDNGAKLTLKNLTVSDGFSGGAGGGVLNFGTLTVTNSTFSQNSAREGGGIANDGTLTVNSSTFSLNDASQEGGGITGSGVLTVTNSTFYLNNAGSQGGGIDQSDLGTLTVTDSTFSRNSAFQGGGIATSGNRTTLSNTIMADNPDGENCFGTITDGGYNIDDGTTCGFKTANNSQPNTDPRLDQGGLQHNGGPTQTIALLQGSPALNAIPKGQSHCATTTDAIATDQRGV